MSAEVNVTAARQAVPKPPSASSGAPGNTDDSCPLKTCGDCKRVKLLIYQRVMFVKVILCAVWRVTPSAQPLPVFQRFWLPWWFSRNIWSSRECGLQADTGQMSFTLLNWACKTSIKGHTHMYIYIYYIYIYIYIYTCIYWLVVSISLKKYESQLGWLFPICGKIMFQTTNQPLYTHCITIYLGNPLFIYTLWLFNVAMENGPFLGGLPGFTY